MNIIVSNYTFDPAAGTIEFDDYTSISVENVVGIVNITKGEVLYDPKHKGHVGIVATNVLTLAHTTQDMSSTDKLLIVYWDEDAVQTVRDGYKGAGEDIPNDVMKVEMRGTPFYQAVAEVNVIVSSDPAYLFGIIIGKDVASSVVEISDHVSDGDGNVKVYLEGSTLLTSTGGYVPINLDFEAGITADLTNQTNVTFVYRSNA